MKIDVNGATVNYASSLAASNTSGLTLTSTASGGFLNLNAVNSYTGLTTVTSGTLQFGVGNAISGPVTVAGGALFLQSFNQALGAVIMTGGSIAGTGTLTTSAPAFDLQAAAMSPSMPTPISTWRSTPRP
jgi:autotransporter-associated beta strand protein